MFLIASLSLDGVIIHSLADWIKMLKTQMLALVAILLVHAPVAGQGSWFGDGEFLWSNESAEVVPVTDLPGPLRSIARTASGGAWIALADEAQVIHVDASGAILEVIDTVMGVQSLAIDSTGRLWGTRPGMDDVIRIESSQGIFNSYPVGAVPYGIAIDKEGSVWVTCSYSNNIYVLSGEGEVHFIYPVGFFPTGIAAAREGGVWVAEKDAMRRIDLSGDTVWQSSIGNFPIGVTTDLQGRAWFSCKFSDLVVVVGSTGVEMTIDVPSLPVGISGQGDGTVSVICVGDPSLVVIDAVGSVVAIENLTDPAGSGDLTGLQRAILVEPLGDTDGDLVTNELEAELGYNPLDASSSPATFIRGDVDRSGTLNLADGVNSLLVLFGIQETDCLEAHDFDDDGSLTLADPIQLLTHLFGNGPGPAAPFPERGPDPTPAQGFPCSP